MTCKFMCRLTDFSCMTLFAGGKEKNEFALTQADVYNQILRQAVLYSNVKTFNLQKTCLANYFVVSRSAT